MKPSDDLIVSSVEPSGSNRKKVWIQKGKNFFDTSNLPSQSNLGIDISFENSAIKLNGTSTGVGILYNQKPTVITLKAGTYTFSLTKKGGTITRNNQEVAFYLRKQGTSTVLATLTLATFVSNDKKSETFTITEETEIDIYMYVNTSGMVFSNLILGIQLEQGPTATSYEAYIEPKIYVKNGNDVYEEFVNIDEMRNVKDFVKDVSFNEAYANVSFLKNGNIVEITYQGENKTHSQNQLLFTLPEGVRPAKVKYFPFVKNANTYGTIIIGTDGTCVIGQISNASISGRIYFTITYII